MIEFEQSAYPDAATAEAIIAERAWRCVAGDKPLPFAMGGKCTPDAWEQPVPTDLPPVLQVSRVLATIPWFAKPTPAPHYAKR